MAVNIGNVGAGVTGKTITITTAGAGDFLIVAAMGINASSETASCTYNGVAMTAAVSQVSGQHRVYFFYLANPTSGSNTATVAWTNGGGLYYTYAYTLSGVLLTNPIDSVTSQGIGGGGASLALNPLTNGTVVLDAICAGTTAGSYVSSGGGLTFTENGTHGNSRSSASGYLVVGDSASLSFSYSGQNGAVESAYIAMCIQANVLSTPFIMRMV